MPATPPALVEADGLSVHFAIGATANPKLEDFIVDDLERVQDGHETDDITAVNPTGTEAAVLLHCRRELAAIDALVAEAHPGMRWRYTMHAGCELEVDVRNGEVGCHRVALEAAVVDTRSADGVTEVRRVPKIGGQTQAVVVLSTRQWTGTVWARSLPTHLEVRRGAPVPPAS